MNSWTPVTPELAEYQEYELAYPELEAAFSAESFETGNRSRPGVPRPAAPSGRVVQLPPVYIVSGPPFQILNRFAFNSAALTADHLALVRGIACHVRDSQRTSRPVRLIVLEGHTDNAGSDDVNIRLGQQRADAVRAVLARELGNLAVQLVAQSLGKSSPAASNAEPGCRALNRRVEVFLSRAAQPGGTLPGGGTPPGSRVPPGSRTPPGGGPGGGWRGCVTDCIREAERRAGHPLSREEQWRIRRRCERDCSGRPV